MLRSRTGVPKFFSWWLGSDNVLLSQAPIESLSKKKPSQVHLLSRRRERVKLLADGCNSPTVWWSLPTVQPSPFAKAINHAFKFNAQPKKAAD